MSSTEYIQSMKQIEVVKVCPYLTWNDPPPLPL